MNPLLIYIWGQVDNIHGFCKVMTVLSIVGFILLTIGLIIATADSADGKIISALRNFRRVFIISLFCVLPFSLFLPSSKTIALMVVLPAIEQSKVIQQDLPDIYNLAVEQLKVKLKETAEKAEE